MLIYMQTTIFSLNQQHKITFTYFYLHVQLEKSMIKVIFFIIFLLGRQVTGKKVEKREKGDLSK